MPEDFPAAVCVPVSTPTTLLGTLWVFCNEKRDFNDRETNMLEVVAGRLASDLEREMLLRSGTDGAELQKQVAAAERLQRSELPTISPLLDGWGVAGWTAQAEGVGGAFHDWFCLPRGLLAVAVGKAARARHRRRTDGQRREDGRPRPRPIPPPGRTHPAASQSDALDRLGRRSARRAVLRADRDGHGPGVLCLGRPGFRVAAARDGWQSLSQSRRGWAKVPSPTSSNSATNFSRAKCW